MSKEETPPMIRWLRRYILRGLGWVFWAAVFLLCNARETPF